VNHRDVFTLSARVFVLSAPRPPVTVRRDVGRAGVIFPFRIALHEMSPLCKEGLSRKCFDARPAIALEVISTVILDALLGMHLAQPVGPAALEQSGEGVT